MVSDRGGAEQKWLRLKMYRRVSTTTPPHKVINAKTRPHPALKKIRLTEIIDKPAGPCIIKGLHNSTLQK